MKAFISIAVLALAVVGAVAEQNNTTGANNSTSTVAERNDTTEANNSTSNSTGGGESTRFLEQLAEAFGGKKQVEVSKNEYGYQPSYGYPYAAVPARKPARVTAAAPNLFDPLFNIFKLGQPAKAAVGLPNLLEPFTKVLTAGAVGGKKKKGILNPLDAFANIFKGLQPTEEEEEEDDDSPASPSPPPTTRVPSHYPPYIPQYPGYYPYPPYPYPYPQQQLNVAVEKVGKKYTPVVKKVVYEED